MKSRNIKKRNIPINWVRGVCRIDVKGEKLGVKRYLYIFTIINYFKE